MARGPLGVRRPLRFLAHRLGLDPRQMQTFADVIEDWKTEYAQAEVDGRRARKQLTKAIGEEGFDAEAAAAALEARAESRSRVESGVVSGLQELHVVMSPEQRNVFAMLLRMGEISL
jgi:uncharacterized membrane protein